MSSRLTCLFSCFSPLGCFCRKMVFFEQGGAPTSSYTPQGRRSRFPNPVHVLAARVTKSCCKAILLGFAFTALLSCFFLRCVSPVCVCPGLALCRARPGVRVARAVSLLGSHAGHCSHWNRGRLYGSSHCGLFLSFRSLLKFVAGKGG